MDKLDILSILKTDVTLFRKTGSLEELQSLKDYIDKKVYRHQLNEHKFALISDSSNIPLAAPFPQS